MGAALARIAGWQFALICAVHGLSVIADTLGWRATFAPGARPSWRRLFVAKCAGDAVDVVTALGVLGGEATKVWLLRREVPYATSVTSLLVTKTSLVLCAGAAARAGDRAGDGHRGRQRDAPRRDGRLAPGRGGRDRRFPARSADRPVGPDRPAPRVGGSREACCDGAAGSGVARLLPAGWRCFVVATGFHSAGSLIGALEGLLVLRTLGVSASLSTATVIEALGSGVRFATFFVPASLGALEGANAAAFTAFGWAAAAGLAFPGPARATDRVDRDRPGDPGGDGHPAVPCASARSARGPHRRRRGADPGGPDAQVRRTTCRSRS